MEQTRHNANHLVLGSDQLEVDLTNRRDDDKEELRLRKKSDSVRLTRGKFEWSE